YLHTAVEWVRQNPAAWLKLLARKWMMVWNACELFDTEDYYLYAERSRMLAALDRCFSFLVLCPLAAAGIVATWKQRGSLWFLYAWLLVNAAATALFVVFARYRAVLVPVLCLFAAAGVLGIASATTHRRWNEILKLGVVAAVAMLATTWPVHLRRATQP